MNYLVHCWLGRSNAGLQAGGFLGDFIKGRLDDELPTELMRGLKLHRFIDAQTNHLKSMRNTYDRFGSNLRRPAPILLDLVADHVFAKHWSEFAEGSIESFTGQCYEVIGSYPIPASAQRMYQHMCDTDLFARYAQLEVIEEIMVRILKRLKFDQEEQSLAVVLREQASGFKQDFERYFPQLELLVDKWLQANPCP